MESAQCGADGACETNGFCSFPDSSCPSGRKYGDQSGDAAGKCVGQESGGIDSAVVDTAMIDMPAACPMGYTAMGTSSYRFVTQQDDWLAAEMDCENDGTGTHLAVAGDMAELTLLGNLAQDNYWLGASDRVTEATWLWVTGGAGPNLGMGNGSDCARGNDAGNLSDQDCGGTEVYVCECDGMAAMPATYTP
jgi:hypothetical protein